MSQSQLDTSKERPPYWETSIIKIEHNNIMIRGYQIEDLIGRVSYAEMVYLGVMGELPSPEKARLLEAVLVAGCDFGVYSPAVAISRMAATCGITFNSAMATGMNVLGNIHGGAGEEAMELFYSVHKIAIEENRQVEEVIDEKVGEYLTSGRFLPGYGHPVIDDCPRVKRLFEMGRQAVEKRAITGEYMNIANGFQESIQKIKNRRLPINVDAAVAAIQCELGLPSEISKGLFSLSRGIGLLAHVFEETTGYYRLKTPAPKDVMEKEFVYVGPKERPLPEGKRELP